MNCSKEMVAPGGLAAKSMNEKGKTSIETFADVTALSQATADKFSQLARGAVRDRGRFLVCLSGGSTPVSTYQILAQQASLNDLPWEKMVFFWGDERMVPPDHPESNYGQANQILLRHVPVKNENILRIRGDLTALEAVKEYTCLLQYWAVPGDFWPRFDLLLLGMGADGHIASIFPGSSFGDSINAPVLSVSEHYQGRPVERVTLTPLVFNSARKVIFLVAGAEKAEAVAAVFDQRGRPEDWPARLIQPEDGSVDWMIDAAAAAKIKVQ